MTDQQNHTPIFNAAMHRRVRILLIEDSPSDVAMTLEALRDARIANEMHVVGDGEEAMDFLLRQGQFTDMSRPDLVILDLNLPKMDGREVLRRMKLDDDLRTIPVVILTTSAAEADTLASYQLQANAYVTKPVGYDAFYKAVRGIEGFWLDIVRLPSD